MCGRCTLFQAKIYLSGYIFVFFFVVVVFTLLNNGIKNNPNFHNFVVLCSFNFSFLFLSMMVFGSVSRYCLEKRRLLHTHTVFAQNSNMISWLFVEWKIRFGKKDTGRVARTHAHTHNLSHSQYAILARFSLSLFLCLSLWIFGLLAHIHLNTHTRTRTRIYVRRERHKFPLNLSLWWWRFGPF